MGYRLRRILSPPVFENEDKTRFARQLNVSLLTVLAIVLLYIVGVVDSGVVTGERLIVASIMSIILLALRLLMQRGRVRLASVILTSVIWAFFVIQALGRGSDLYLPTTLGYINVVIMAGILLGPRAAVGFAGLSILVELGVLLISATEAVPEFVTPLEPIVVWFITVSHLCVAAGLVSVAVYNIGEAYIQVRRNERTQFESNRELQTVRDSLEHQVAERTAQLEVSAEVSRAVASILDSDDLMRQVVQWIVERFDFYYAAVFIIDAEYKAAVLREATGTAGKVLKKSGHRVRLDSDSIVSAAVVSKSSRVSNQADKEHLYSKNPLLPDTRSEIALPLTVGGQTLGVLDVHSSRADAFDKNTVATLQGLADQIAIALNNARQFQKAQTEARQATALFEASQLVGVIGDDLSAAAEQLLRIVAEKADFDSWHSAILDPDTEEYVVLTSSVENASQNGNVPNKLTSHELHAAAPMMLAVQERQVIVINNPAADPRLNGLSDEARDALGKSVSAPAMHRNQVLATLRLGRGLSDGDISSYDVQLAQAVANQLAVTIANHRLYEQAQSSAHEHDELMKRYTHEGWSRYKQTFEGLDDVSLHEYSESGAKPLDNDVMLHIDQAARSDSPGPIIIDGQSTVGIPISLRGQVIGTLGVQDKPDRHWTSDELATLNAVANQIAQSVEVARLLDETESSLQETTELYQASRAMAAASSPEDVMDIAVKTIHAWLAVDQVRLVLFDEEKGYGSIVAQAVPVEAVKSIRIPMIGNPTYEELAKTLRPIAIEDVANDPVTSVLSGLFQRLGIRSMLLLPLVVGRRVIGSIGADVVQRTRRFSEKEMTFCETLARQAAVAIENRRLFEETQRRAEIETTLNTVSQSIRASLDPQAVLDLESTVGEMGRLLGSSRSFYLTNEGDEHFVRVYEWNAQGVDSPASSTGLWNTLPWTIETLKAGQAIVTEKVDRDDPPELRADMHARGVLSHLQVPVQTGSRLMGVLGFEQTDLERRWTQEEISMVRRVADQLAAALENARLYESVRHRVNELTVLTRIGRRLTATLDLDEVLALIVTEAINTTQSDRGSMSLYNEGEDALEVAYMRGYTLDVQEKMLGTLLRKGASLHGRILITREAVLVADVQLEYDYMNIDPATRSEYLVPLLQGDTLLGALNLESSLVNAYSETDSRLMEALADQAAVAIINANAYAAERSALERLREVDRLKTEFLANMSHELRTPLNSIIGFSRVILRGIDGPLTDLQQADLTAIHNSGQHLLGLINNILDLSKIEAGKLELSIEEIDLREVIKVVMSTAIALVKDKDVQLRQEVADELPLINADATRIRQVLLNLVSNASKFTEEGEIVIRVDLKDDEVLVSVSDTGMGIPENQLDHIFEEFTQVDASTTRRVGGTGLGLAITRKFVELHGGRIWVTSKPGVGSTFFFNLPLEPAEDPQQDTPSDDSVGSDDKVRSILCIDDDPGVITLYRRYLEKQGFHVVGLTDATKAVDEARKLQPFAITLDVLMPTRDGWEVLGELKSTPETSNIPILVCSIIKDESKAFSLGATDYLVKPITEDELLRALEQAEIGNSVQSVLIIDDDPDARRLIRRLLEEHAIYQVTEAEGGALGIAAVEKHIPDLIVLDLMMPDVDGFAVLEYLKSNSRTRHIPILIVTAKELTDEDVNRLQGQANALLNKGAIAPEELLSEIVDMLHKIESQIAPQGDETVRVANKV